MPEFTEKSVIEDCITKKLQEKGWSYVPVDELERERREKLERIIEGV